MVTRAGCIAIDIRCVKAVSHVVASAAMQPIAALTPDIASGIEILFTDIDGTLTTHGKVTDRTYAALWRLHEAGIRVVPVTGRPAGWCDLIAREWPVQAVVGENGALVFYETDGALRRFYHPDVASGEGNEKLQAIREAILAEVPGARVAKDQRYRLFDLAIDYCEEPPDLGLDTAERIRAIFERLGAHAKVSNIHVNGWFGSYDKLAMVKLFAHEIWGTDLQAEPSRYVFCGDSPNDEPMFAFFPNGCAVANIAPFAPRMTYLPRYVSEAEQGAGFAEIVEVILARRNAA